MAAPGYGSGRYTHSEIAEVLRTAVVGFAACKAESDTNECVVYTGNWGCGAFGGNPVLMALLQFCAARIAGVDKLRFHPLSNKRDCEKALVLFDELMPRSPVQTSRLLDSVEKLGLQWGTSDGN
jgi:hypothetical protein